MGKKRIFKADKRDCEKEIRNLMRKEDHKEKKKKEKAEELEKAQKKTPT